MTPAQKTTRFLILNLQRVSAAVESQLLVVCYSRIWGLSFSQLRKLLTLCESRLREIRFALPVDVLCSSNLCASYQFTGYLQFAGDLHVAGLPN